MCKLQVLLVEDDAAILSLMTDLLEIEGYGVCIATDGQTALDYVERNAPDIVISDVIMPRVDGIELARRLRKQQVPVILMSATPLKNKAADVEFIQKPFDLDAMTDALNRALSQDNVTPC